jgi:hypothetical protein
VVSCYTDSSSGAEAVDFDNIFFTGSVPEPATLALVAIGAVFLAGRRRRFASSS